MILGGTHACILLYVDDIVFLFESEHDLQRHLSALDDFCTQCGLILNLGKTKVLIFHTSAQVRTKCHLTISHTPIEVVESYIYLKITFNARSGKFSMNGLGTER